MKGQRTPHYEFHNFVNHNFVKLTKIGKLRKNVLYKFV